MAVHLWSACRPSAPCSVACRCHFLCTARTHSFVSIWAQVSDGAAASLLMTRREAQRRGLPVLGIWRGFSAVGVPPEIMGDAPPLPVACVPPCFQL